MDLPDWAEQAFEKRRPLGGGKTGPDPDRLAWWVKCKQRFERRWEDIAPDKWKVPLNHACYLHLPPGWDPMSFVRLCILETALDLGSDKAFGRRPAMVPQAVKELERLNDEIAKSSADLATLFRLRDSMKTDHWISDYGDEPLALDPFDFWDALEEVSNLPHVSGWANVAHYETTRFLSIARSQSRVKPRWHDILDQVANRAVRAAIPNDAGDKALMDSRTNATEWSPWGLRLLGTLDGWPDFPKGFLINCLTKNQLAYLAEVALDAPLDAYNPEQMRALFNRYKKPKR